MCPKYQFRPNAKSDFKLQLLLEAAIGNSAPTKTIWRLNPWFIARKAVDDVCLSLTFISFFETNKCFPELKFLGTTDSTY